MALEPGSSGATEAFKIVSMFEVGRMGVQLRLCPVGGELWQTSCQMKVEMVDMLLRPYNLEVQR